MSDNLWGYQPSSGYAAGTDLTGFSVEAIDGSIGKVDKHSDGVGSSHLLIDTGVWIFGKEVLLPAGTVTRIDTEDRKVYVDLTKEQIKGSPDFDRQSHVADPGYHAELGTYYAAHRFV
ncbi:PRC-barrel domain-containing protein [uncultured Streptomyces sp.]|uniref:PRC-barrel domain-containing protein n=1 Tax=uncultured Streptomyces sp. TaxID=174707 RepID=UPI00261574DA|nr:PRC-barrel domain-containing protein [uncultured Streptomyces sp.]